MKKIMIALCFTLQAAALFAQNTESPLYDADITTKLENIKDNIDDLFNAFKTDSQPDPEVNFNDSYITSLKFYTQAGSISATDFDNNLSFRISSSDFPEATKADFEEAYTTISENLKTIFDDLEVVENKSDKEEEITLFEMGKDVNAPVISPNSPRYYINLSFKEEQEDNETEYSLFLYFTSKK